VCFSDLPTAERDAELRKWLDAVERLVSDVEEWSRAEGWDVEREEDERQERSLGRYAVPVLRIRTPSGDGFLKPIGHDVGGARGRVDLSAWPTLYRVMLLLTDRGGWRVRTDSGIDWPEPWGRETFLHLVDGLSRAQ